MAKVRVHTNMAQGKSPPLFPSVAAAVGAESAFGEPIVVHEATLTENRDPMPGMGCLWCWQVHTAATASQSVEDGRSGMAGLLDFLPGPLAYALGLDQKRDYLEIEGGDSFPAISADWSVPNAKGALCSHAPLFFDVWNATGSKGWGRGARGSIVVARRGPDLFETTTRRAEAAGAVAVVFLDDREEWDDDLEMTLDSAGAPPGIPAVLVPKRAESILTGTEKFSAIITRR